MDSAAHTPRAMSAVMARSVSSAGIVTVSARRPCRACCRGRRSRTSGLLQPCHLRLQTEQTLQPLDHAELIRVGPIERFENVEAFSHRIDRTDAELTGAARNVVGVAAPDENRARAGVDRDVQTILGTVVDDHVERERGGNLAARSMDDEDRWL